MAMTAPLGIPALGIAENEAQSLFEALQEKPVPLWDTIKDFNSASCAERNGITYQPVTEIAARLLRK